MSNGKAMTDGDRIVGVIDRLLSDLEVLCHIPLVQKHMSTSILAENRQFAQLLEQMYRMEKEFHERSQNMSSSSTGELTEMRDNLKLLIRDVVATVHRHHGLLDMLRNETRARMTEEEIQRQEAALEVSIFSGVRSIDPSGSGIGSNQTAIVSTEDIQHAQIGAQKVLGFLRVMQDVRDLLKGKLDATVEDDKIREEQKDEVAAREKKANADLKALQRELSTVQNAREKEVSLREESLKKVSKELEKLKAHSSARRRALETSLAENEALATGKYRMVTEWLNKEIEKKESEIREKERGYVKKERQLMIDKKGLEDAIHRITSEYEEKTTNTNEQIEELEREIREAQEKLKFYEKEIKQMKTERELKQKEEDKRRSEEESWENFNLRKSNRSASMIQRAWREFKKRKEDKKKSRKKKPKK